MYVWVLLLHVHINVVLECFVRSTCVARLQKSAAKMGDIQLRVDNTDTYIHVQLMYMFILLLG